ncbi:hypothetical protein EVAR_95671_1 [Eumeta japonica]|uniref:Uncharacterized protein n=1 Tax=Eumeta variegata TaxID=151549 RepID=A0A4C1VK59_EUMVA|nr:hypothetical protein EVAR_95671_1 [Eumeta japonica]
MLMMNKGKALLPICAQDYFKNKKNSGTGNRTRASWVRASCNQLFERVEYVGLMGRAEKGRVDPTASPDRVTRPRHPTASPDRVTRPRHPTASSERVTRAFRCDVIARNLSNVPKEVPLQKKNTFLYCLVIELLLSS